MKKLLCNFLLILLPFGLQAEDGGCCEEPTCFLAEFTTGYRRDQLLISVTPPTPDAAVATVNNWKNVDLFQGRMTFKAETCYCTYSRAYFNYGRLVEYRHEFTSPTLILDPSETYHEKGRVYDAEYAFGFSLRLRDCLRLTPLTGYSYHRIEFRNNHRTPRTIPATSAEAAEYDYLKVVETQRTTWRAPFVGMEIEFLLGGCTRICLNGQYLWAHYNNHGKTHEKYIQSYRYKQRSDGHGTIFYGEVGYTFLKGWEAVLAGGYQYWDAKGGKDWTKHPNSDAEEVASHLNKVTWKSYEVSLGLGYVF